MQLRPKQISVFYTFIYWVCEGHKKRGRGAGSMCPSLAYKFNSDKNRFLPRFRLNSILGYVSERDIRFVLFFFFCCAQFSSRWDCFCGRGREGEWPLSMAAASGVALPVCACVSMSATGMQHAHRGQRKGDRARLP